MQGYVSFIHSLFIYLLIYLFKNFGAHTRYKVKPKTKKIVSNSTAITGQRRR